jgi:formylglycine-generating enzyme required for sulfatase activity
MNNLDQVPTITNDKDGSVLALVDQGVFLSSSPGQAGALAEPLSVFLPSFYLAIYCVTNGQYRRFAQDTKRPMPYFEVVPGVERLWFPEGADHQPVHFVTFREASAYCDWAGLRLPTALEWEKGARGVDGRAYPWGNQWDEHKCCRTQAPPFGTADVFAFPEGRSPWGMYQMIGNVGEWCSDDSSEGGIVYGWPGIEPESFKIGATSYRPTERGRDRQFVRLLGIRCAKNASAA